MMFILLATSVGLSIVGIMICFGAAHNKDEMEFCIPGLICVWFLVISIVCICREFKFEDYEISVEYGQYEVRIAEEKLQELQLNSKNP